jgi:2-oxoglutarate dehydrogenase E2 component (dihydrolipoamide succinyltransferase)
MFLRRVFSVFLSLAWCAVFNSICAAAPLMVEKNLFANDRKPPPPESADASAKPAKAGMPVGNIQLDGIIIESNGKRAILRMKNPPAAPAAKKGQPASPFVTVREGQMVSDFRVAKIESKSIALEKDGQTFTIGLFAENKVASPPSPTPAAPAPAPQPAPQEAGSNQPADAQPQPGGNPPPQPVPAQAQPIPPNRGFAGNRNVSPNINAPVPEPGISQDPNQPAETVEVEQ